MLLHTWACVGLYASWMTVYRDYFHCIVVCFCIFFSWMSMINVHLQLDMDGVYIQKVQCVWFSEFPVVYVHICTSFRMNEYVCFSSRMSVYSCIAYQVNVNKFILFQMGVYSCISFHMSVYSCISSRGKCLWLQVMQSVHVFLIILRVLVVASRWGWLCIALWIPRPMHILAELIKGHNHVSMSVASLFQTRMCIINTSSRGNIWQVYISLEYNTDISLVVVSSIRKSIVVISCKFILKYSEALIGASSFPDNALWNIWFTSRDEETPVLISSRDIP